MYLPHFTLPEKCVRYVFGTIHCKNTWGNIRRVNYNLTYFLYGINNSLYFIILSNYKCYQWLTIDKIDLGFVNVRT